MDADSLSQPQLDLLFHAGIYGLCRIPAQAVADLNALRDAGFVALQDDCFRLTRRGAQHVAAMGGKLTARHLH